MKETSWSGISASNALANSHDARYGSCWLKKSRNGTNCTMSRLAVRPLADMRPLSLSSSFMDEKSAFPIPTMIIDMARLDAEMIAYKIKTRERNELHDLKNRIKIKKYLFCVVHITNCSVCEDKKNKVMISGRMTGGEASNMINYRCKISRAKQLN